MLRKLLRLWLVPFALIVVAAVRLLRPFVTIRFGMIWSTRMGHMAGNMACYLNERAAGLSNGLDFWYHHGEPCSAQLDRMLSRVVRIDRSGFARICDLVNQLFSGWERHHIGTAQVDRDIHNLFEKYQPHLYFTDEEVVRGESGLRALGIPEGAKWIYLIVRDSAKHPHLPYHSYRNADIKDHAPAAKWLADQGYYVVRAGKNVLEPMPVKHPRIIDFAMNVPHDDFMYMYLGAKCAFCVSTGTGPDAIPVIFRRPICYVNYVPIEYLQTYHRGSLAIWKHHEKDGKRMTLAEIYKSGAGMFMAAEQFEEAGITLVDNTPEEITDAVKEMEAHVSGAGVNKDWLLFEQAAFWRDFPRSSDGAPLHGEILMRIGAEFLKGYA